MEQKLLTIPEHMSSPPVFSVVRFTPSLVLCVCFADRCFSFCTVFFWSLCCLFFDIRIMVSSNSSYRIYKKKLIKLPKLIKRIVCQFSQYYWGTLHNCLFFPKKTDDETTILVVYDIYFINQLLKNDNNKNKQTKNKQSKNKQAKNKQSQKKIKTTIRQTTVQLKSYTKDPYEWIFQLLSSNTTLVSNNLTDYGRRRLTYFVLNITI